MAWCTRCTTSCVVLDDNLVVIVHCHDASPPTIPLTVAVFATVAEFAQPPLSVQALRMSPSPARAKDRTRMLGVEKGVAWQ